MLQRFFNLIVPKDTVIARKIHVFFLLNSCLILCCEVVFNVSFSRKKLYFFNDKTDF
jgi:hypothetical protein